MKIHYGLDQGPIELTSEFRIHEMNVESTIEIHLFLFVSLSVYTMLISLLD